jgi:hypothetical protein
MKTHYIAATRCSYRGELPVYPDDERATTMHTPDMPLSGC